MTDIDVQRTGSGFAVTVTEAETETRHEVTASEDDLNRLGGGYDSPEDFIKGCFLFLLAREPKEQILSQFDVTAISRYFPEFEGEIRR